MLDRFDRSVRRPFLGAMLVIAVAALPAMVGATARQDPTLPLVVGEEPAIDAGALRATVFAEGLFYPLGMAELADGSILVGTSVPDEGSFFGSTGELRRLSDADGDGVADGPGEVLATGLPGAITAVRRAGSLVYAVSAQPAGSRISALRAGDEPEDPLTLLGGIDFLSETAMEHGTYALAVRQVPGRPERHELFFNVGAVANDAAGGTVTLDGLAAGTLRDASIYRLTVDDAGAVPVFSGLTLIATGLRNAAGIVVHPETGDLLFEDNGIDTPENRIVALGADELNRIAAGGIGGAVEDFGFPGGYVDARTGEAVGRSGTPPLVAFLPRDGDESEGAAEIAVAPAGFPPGVNDGVVVGFHGQWDEVGLENEENPLLYVDLATGEVFPLVDNGEPGIGHLDGLLATDDALYVADLTGRGSLVGTEATGVVYRIAPAETGGD